MPLGPEPKIGGSTWGCVGASSWSCKPRMRASSGRCSTQHDARRPWLSRLDGCAGGSYRFAVVSGLELADEIGDGWICGRDLPRSTFGGIIVDSIMRT
jgi:hypothetical protein